MEPKVSSNIYHYIFHSSDFDGRRISSPYNLKLPVATVPNLFTAKWPDQDMVANKDPVSI